MGIIADTFRQREDMAYPKGIIKDGSIGKCRYMFFDIWDVVSLYRKEPKKNPFQLYGLERQPSVRNQDANAGK